MHPDCHSSPSAALSLPTRLHPFRAADERSFSLFETVIAVGMLAVVFLYVSGIQGQVIYSLEYGQKLSQALWIARGVLSQVEHEWDVKDFSEMQRSVKDKKVAADDFGASADKTLSEFSYTLNIEEWQLPLLSFLTGEESSGGGSSGNLIAEQINAIFGGHMMKMAHVEVFWPEGAQRASTSLSMLLVNQKAVDQQILVLKTPGAQKSAPSSDPLQQFTDPKNNTSNSPSRSPPAPPPTP